MAYSRSETIRLATEAKQSAEAFLSNISNLPGEITNFVSDVNSVIKTINNNFNVAEINNNCVKGLKTDVIDKVTEASELIAKAKISAVKEANNCIKSLQDSYNSSRLNPEEEPYLTLPLVNESASTNPGTGNSNPSPSGGGSQGSNPQPNSDASKQMSKILNSGDANSNRIPEWKKLVSAFLKENNLDKSIGDISIINGQVFCNLSNRQRFALGKVSNTTELLSGLKKVIKK